MNIKEKRRGAILIGIALLLAFVVIFSLQVVAGYYVVVNTFFWGMLIGFLLGLVTCFYLSHAWDPEFLEPTDPRTAKASFRIWWVVPLGVVAANIISKYMSDELQYLMDGIIMTWLFVTIGYMVIQAWRHRP